MVRLTKIFFFILVCSYFSIFAQESGGTTFINTEFKLGIDNYNSKQYTDAQKIFKTLSGSNNSFTTISTIFNAKSLLQLNQTQNAEEILKGFLEVYPFSRYADEAKIMLAKIYIDEKKYSIAFNEIDKIISTTKSIYYLDYAKSSGEKIALNYLTSFQIKSYYISSSSSEMKPYFLLLIGESFLKEEKIDSAKTWLSELTKEFPKSSESHKAEKLIFEISNQEKASSSFPLIAVLLPLNKPPEKQSAIDASYEILEGVKFAVSEYNNDHNDKIGLLIENTGRSKSKIDSIKNYLDSLSTLKVIIGPIYSDEVKETLEAFKNNNVPIISPTATDDGLTEMYPDFFQANPTFTIRGKIMAEYIYYVENKRRMAILNSDESYAKVLADSFQKEFEKLGGKILVRLSFTPGTIDFSRQVTKIAQDSAKLQGIYLPLTDNRDVPSILSQFLSSNLDLNIYGDQDWLLAKGFESYSSLSDKLIFDSDYFLDYSDSTFRLFSKRFFDQTGLDVNRNVLYGYDISKYILSFLSEQNISKNSLKNKLDSGIIYRGFHNNIFFDSERINKFLNIIRYKNGKFELIDRFKMGK
ncbi:MAG: ABC transporter substrate-binding protein [Ignavibacteriaceae bacterium]